MAAFAARNRDTNGNLKALGRMTRIWRDRHGVPLSSMLIDTLAFQFIERWEHRDRSYRLHDRLMLDFFAYLAQLGRTQTYWRAPGSHAYKGNFQTPARNAYRLAASAIVHEINLRPQTARNKWREIFGPTYP